MCPMSVNHNDRTSETNLKLKSLTWLFLLVSLCSCPNLQHLLLLLFPQLLLYLYSEVEHQAIWVSLRQLIEEISPRCVRYHLLKPSRSLKGQETGFSRFLTTFICHICNYPGCLEISPLPQRWRWNQLSGGQSVLSEDSWGDFLLVLGPVQAPHLNNYITH